MAIKIAPSILSADFRNLEAAIKRVEKDGADLIHIDVMDGHFVPNITIGPLIVKAVRKITKLPLDVHLMIENPDKYIPVFAKAGADIITIHVEASRNIGRDIELMKDNNVKSGLVVNPATPVDGVFPYLSQLAMVLLMSVNPGFEGQKFMAEVLPKIRALRAKIIDSPHLNVENNKPPDIEVDGGLNLETAPEVVKAGANVLVAGSAIFYDKNPASVIKKMKALK
ncbi:ribulose-phosphate 3-epimerase [Candidatus Falkowbacteria bacterium RIFCSPLOWO2_12_FULL_45_13]|uniref:Ribulose-phosphate 3-epimerase n=2 Tax=Bacteria TaxID=2 RepID=A0A1F4RAX3_UNCSA|nr:MAG: ribulose-phosphate 3-epimerase [candidate division WOR-1 bacterium RIFCSPHIGHO2_02_FULL_45_12]OGC05315.1 MAG: ribulose-phosphate 3-epimerase [candidate division WOR-1 bacterium RIFCSPLOWO2_02_FULL_46_20]OGF32126.1 MAG: ribulose-phosphate 3-epimerase [Candidatus Falkowbacteria bacterium RIFCSPLOWO2_12_FULL_45_13]